MIWVEEKSILEARQAQLATKRANYKEIHKGTAERKGCLNEFMRATTITQMRKLCFG